MDVEQALDKEGWKGMAETSKRFLNFGFEMS
jgi:hypothetical protein